MFQETEFDDDDDLADCKATKRRRLEANPSRVEELMEAAASIKRLHRPGDKHFSLVAGSTPLLAEQQKERGDNFDQKLSSGDQWLTNECRCIQCEVIRVSGQCLTALPADTVVVLLDLDNFGFHQFKRKPPRLDLTTGERKRIKRKVQSSVGGGAEPLSSSPIAQLSTSVLGRIFVWAFYGSCFGRHYGCLPHEILECAPKGSIWSSLQSSKRVHFTPCGGHDQAVDEVIVAISAALAHRKHLVISKDRHLAETIESSKGNSVLGAIDVNDCERQLPGVWKQLALLTL